jgi:hypothetical protein
MAVIRETLCASRDIDERAATAPGVAAAVVERASATAILWPLDTDVS